MGTDGLTVLFALVALFGIGYYIGRIHTMRKIADAIWKIRKELNERYKVK